MTPLLASGPVRMFRLSNDPGERGFSCTPDGVALAGITLIRKTPAGFIPRPAGEIASLLKAAYGDRPMALPSRLDTIAKALNSGDFAMAMIAAVHTQTPELDAAAAMRLAQAEDRLAKYNYDPDEPRDGRGRWTAEGSDASIDPTALPTDDNREAGADNRPQRVAENTFPPRGSASSDAPVSSGDNISGAPADGEASHKPTTLQETFEQKYDGLKTEEFAKQVGLFGYWLEAHGRELSPAEKERALAEYSFLQDRLSSRIYREDTSAGEDRYLLYAALQLYQGATNSGLVPVGHLPASMLAVGSAAAAFDTPSPSRLRPTPRLLTEGLATEPHEPPENIAGGIGRETAGIARGKDITEQVLGGGAAEVSASLAEPQIIGSFPVPKDLKFGTTPFGDYAHRAVGDLLRELYPEAKFILRVGRGQTEVDVQVRQESINTVGFRYGEIKPLSASGKSRFNRQVLDWDLPEPVQPITYDAAGNVFLGFH
jgi:hypothetical protein